MRRNQRLTSRRRFLVQSITYLAGTLMGLPSFSRALAYQGEPCRPPGTPCMALIIDDIGFSQCCARQFLDLEVPLTFSILPRLPYSLEVSKEIHSAGHEIMLHQPMESVYSHMDPGPGAIYVSDSEDRITSVVKGNISSIPFAAGVNNHMGSRFTTCQGKMEQALQVLKARGLFFVDSLTTSLSTGLKTAQGLQIPVASRNIFLDNHLDETSIIKQLHRLRDLALTVDRALGIGHPHPETAKALGLFLKDRERCDVSLVYASRIIEK